MIVSRIHLTDPQSGPNGRTLQIPLSPRYGDSSELAHRTLLICLTGAQHPVVIDVEGGTHHIPRRSLRQVVTWGC